MKKYLLTGYSKTKNKIATRIYDDIDEVAQVINGCEADEIVWAEDEQLIVKSPKDLDFNVQSRRSHDGAEIIDTKKFAWSIFYLK